MRKLSELKDYVDNLGNQIHSPTRFTENIDITIRGRNNRVFIDPGASISKLHLAFDGDNGTLTVGKSSKSGFQLNIRIGQDSTVKIGSNLTTTSTAIVSAVEGVTVSFGDDCMLASENQFRADDGHPIFDVFTGKRVNLSTSIRVGSHVWIGARAVLLAGAEIGDGSVIGFGSIVTKKIPNNCIAAGSPARVVRRNIAWERPHLSLTSPPYKPHVDTVTRSDPYWNVTKDLTVTESNKLSFPQRIIAALGIWRS
jgi:acetyltransferase-like isoleucine patch superfamily enzyme